MERHQGEKAMWGHSENDPSANRGERPQEIRNPLTPWSWTSNLQNCDKLNYCCLRHPDCGILLWRLSKLTYPPKLDIPLSSFLRAFYTAPCWPYHLIWSWFCMLIPLLFLKNWVSIKQNKTWPEWLFLKMRLKKRITLWRIKWKVYGLQTSLNPRVTYRNAKHQKLQYLKRSLDIKA